MLFYIFLLSIISCSSPDLSKLDKTDHFDGDVFFNPNVDMEKSFSDMFSFFTGDKEAWPEWVEINQKNPFINDLDNNSTRVTFINHASVLIETSGLNIITDPIYSERTSPVSFAGPKRHKLPGVSFDNLPKIDFILISHNHYDHMDLPTINRLVERDKSTILIGLGNCYYLDNRISKFCRELDWKNTFTKNDVEITFVEVQHWSKRGLFDRNKALWGGFVIDGTHKIYFGGDTGYGDHFEATALDHKLIDLSILPIGAYEPRWFMKKAHMNPMDALKAHSDLNSNKSLGIHHGTFQLTYEKMKDPIKQIKSLDPSGKFIILENGGSLIMKGSPVQYEISN